MLHNLPLCCFVSCIGNHTLNICLLQEEDATVWARYSSAQFDQGAGRHACNIPCNHDIDDVLAGDLQKNGKTEIAHNDFMDLIAPSFTGVDDKEDMAAILARTHMIVLTDNGALPILQRIVCLSFHGQI